MGGIVIIKADPISDPAPPHTSPNPIYLGLCED